MKVPSVWGLAQEPHKCPLGSLMETVRAGRGVHQILGGREPGEVLGTGQGTWAEESWTWSQEG